MCGDNCHISRRTLIWGGGVWNTGAETSSSCQSGGERRDCTMEDGFFFFLFFFSQDLGEWRLDGGIREKLKTISVNWVQLTDIRGQKMLLSVSGGVRQVDERC